MRTTVIDALCFARAKRTAARSRPLGPTAPSHLTRQTLKLEFLGLAFRGLECMGTSLTPDPERRMLQFVSRVK